VTGHKKKKKKKKKKKRKKQKKKKTLPHSTPKCDVRTHFQLNISCRLRHTQYTGHHGC